MKLFFFSILSKCRHFILSKCRLFSFLKMSTFVYENVDISLKIKKNALFMPLNNIFFDVNVNG